MDTFRLIDLLLLLTPTVILIPFLFQGLSPQGEYPFRLFPLVSLPAFGLLYVAPETYSLKISWLLIEMQWE